VQVVAQEIDKLAIFDTSFKSVIPRMNGYFRTGGDGDVAENYESGAPQFLQVSDNGLDAICRRDQNEF
jgi:hypothetical protein